MTSEERFWSKVDRSGDPNSCWPWIAGCDGKGYGAFKEAGRQEIASRFAYKLVVGPVPAGLWVLHSCDNPPCVNPAHLFLGTGATNSADRNEKGRQAWGERSGHARLTLEDVRNIRALVASGASLASLGRRYRVTTSTAHKAAHGSTWRYA